MSLLGYLSCLEVSWVPRTLDERLFGSYSRINAALQVHRPASMSLQLVSILHTYMGSEKLVIFQLCSESMTRSFYS